MFPHYRSVSILEFVVGGIFIDGMPCVGGGNGTFCEFGQAGEKKAVVLPMFQFILGGLEAGGFGGEEMPTIGPP